MLLSSPLLPTKYLKQITGTAGRNCKAAKSVAKDVFISRVQLQTLHTGAGICENLSGY